MPSRATTATDALDRAGGPPMSWPVPSEASGARWHRRRPPNGVTGYVTGGISPFAPRHKLRLTLDRWAAGFETIAVSGGRRGIQLELSPEVLVEVTEGVLAAIADH